MPFSKIKTTFLQLLACAGLATVFSIGLLLVNNQDAQALQIYVGCSTADLALNRVGSNDVEIVCSGAHSISTIGVSDVIVNSPFRLQANILCSITFPAPETFDPGVISGAADAPVRRVYGCGGESAALNISGQRGIPTPEEACESSGGSWDTSVGNTTGRCVCPVDTIDTGGNGCEDRQINDEGSTGTTEAEAPIEARECANGVAGQAEAEAGLCADSFSRCPSGEYGIVTQNGECLPLNPGADDTPLAENPILIFAGRLITFLAGGIGIILVIVVVIAGLRYTLARGNPQESAAAKSMIEKAVISVVMYLFAFALINWLVPGGLLT